jgi:anti-sigma B factor antagonist
MPEHSHLLIQDIQDVTLVIINERHVRDALLIQQIGDQLYTLVEEKSARKLVIDFSNVQLLSSAALGVLISLKRLADPLKARVVICCLRKELREVFKIARLEKLFEFYDQQEQGLAAFGVGSGG